MAKHTPSNHPETNRPRTVRNFLGWAGFALSVLLLAAYAITATVLGSPQFAIPTMGVSMEPRFHQGDLAIIRSVDPNDVEVGDVIAFRTSDYVRMTYNVPDLVLHTVTEITYDQNDLPVFETKGDNNPEVDPWLTSSMNLNGILIAQVDNAGWPLLLAKGPLGRNLLIVAVGLVVAWYALGFAERQRAAARARADAHEEMLAAISDLREELRDLKSRQTP